MGNISSRLEESPGNILYLKDQNRFSLKSLTVNNGQRNILELSPNAFPATRLNVKRDGTDEAPVSYVQDPDSANLSFLPRLDIEDELTFEFTFVTRQTLSVQSNSASGPATIPAQPSTIDTSINGLTFAYASTTRELDTLVTREFHSDPNLHKNSNVQLIGDFATAGSQSIEYRWTWSWRPPKTAEDRGGGWRNSCSLLEYDSRAHRLNTLASFAFWVHRPVFQPRTPAALSLHELSLPSIRYRIPSSQSYQSAVSDTEGGPESGLLSPGVLTQEMSLPAPPLPTSAPPLPPVPTVDPVKLAEDMSSVEDGPVFRANMKSLEQKSGNLRAQIKKVLRKAEAAQQAQMESNECIRGFLAALQEAASTNASVLKPALENYFSSTAQRILQYEDENCLLLRRQIIEPLARLYTNDIKQIDTKKRDFEEESREYYAYVSRYLGQRQDSMKEKKRAESDSKYQTKKRNFELKRFDYSNFMQDLHGGRKEQELLAQLTRFAEGQAKAFLNASKKIESLQPQLQALSRDVAETNKQYKMQRTEREEKRRNLEMNNPTSSEASEQVSHSVPVQAPVNGAADYRSDTDLSRADSTGSNFGATTSRSNPSPNNLDAQRRISSTLSASPGTSTQAAAGKFQGIRDLEDRSSTGYTDRPSNASTRKEGLVLALSKPGSHLDPKGINKQAWHKFWLVLDQGKLSEYSNWKDRMELHRDPIDLRMASVRVARDADRRFCFEVITPQYKRVYQAMEDADMMNWISSINNALQSAFEGRSTAPLTTSTSAGSGRGASDFANALSGKSLSQSGPHGNNRQDAASLTRRVTVGSRPAYTTPVSGNLDDNPTRLLDQLRANDQGNQFCADCGSNTKVEWVSLNLGIILCIECGGIHRSLGTHVSKVRSLTLDVHSFTDDIVELFMLIGNRISNMIWEANLEPGQKLEPWANREQRLRFISAKYVDRAFVETATSSTYFGGADETLLTSIKRNDITGVLHSIARRADINVHDRSRNTHAVHLALVAADPVKPASQLEISADGSPVMSSIAGGAHAFPVAELLLQNGSEIPSEPPSIPLSPAAKQYLEQRLSGRVPQADTLGPLPVMGSRETNKLQKRSSAGSRFAGKVAGLGER